MKTKAPIRLSDNLRRIMASKSLRVTTLAKKVGMNKSTLHGYLNGVVPRHITKINELAEALGVSFTELVFGAGQDDKLFGISEGELARFEIVVKRVDEKTNK